MRTQMTVGDIPRLHSRRAAGDLAIIDGESYFSWADVDGRVNRLCNGLKNAYGVNSADCIAILSPNCHEFVEVMFASSRLGAMYTGLNTRHHPKEMVRQMLNSGSRLLIAGQDFAEVGGSVAADTGVPLLVLGEGVEGYESLLSNSNGDAYISHGREEAAYALTYTSGTTGEPKGAMISSRGEIAYARAVSWAFESRHDDRQLVLPPMFHKGGQFAVMHAAWLGLPSVLLPAPVPEAIFGAVERHRVTAFAVVPTVMKMMVDEKLRPGAPRWDLSSLRHISYGSNPIEPEMLRQFASLFPCALSQVGGVGTEGGPALVLSRVDHERLLADPTIEHRLKSCGRVQPGFEMKIVDDDDRELPVGERGEMVFRGESFISGYWERPDATAKLWRNGWLHSGDIGLVDDDGYVYYVDRKAGRIKTGGETVYAREVENVLRMHRSVNDVVVVGVPDAKWGEAVWAAVEPSPHSGELPEPALQEELRQFARTQLSGFKVPKRVVRFEQLPRTALGKTAIGEVRAQLLGLTDPTADASGA